VELFQWGRMSQSALYWIVRKSDSLLYCGRTSESLIHSLDNSSHRNGYAVHVATVQSERTAGPDRQSDSCNCADYDTVLALLSAVVS
jgi:hypothetical protein